MKKYLFLILALLLATQESFSHGWTVTRKWCAWGDRYQAWASIDEKNAVPTSSGGVMIYMIVGYDPWGRPVWRWVYHPNPPANWRQVSQTRNVGCTRPKYTWCNHPGGSSVAWSEAKLDFSGQHLRGYTSRANVRYGVHDNVVVDQVKLDGMNHMGSAESDINGDVDLNADGDALHINNVNGFLKIENNSDFYSTYHIVVVKEDSTMPSDDNDSLQAQYGRLEFNNLVAEGSVTLTKAGVESTGILAGLVNAQPNTENDAFVLNIAGINAVIPLNRALLGPNEEFTVITYVDGGFDFSQAAPDGQQRQMQVRGATGFKMLPNPASTHLSIDLPAEFIGQEVGVSVVDITGKISRSLFAGKIDENNRFLTGLDVSELPTGLYLVKVTSGAKTLVEKLMISK